MSRDQWRRWRERIAEALRQLAFVLLVVVVWLVTAIVCGRQAMLISEEGARALMRQLLPGIW